MNCKLRSLVFVLSFAMPIIANAQVVLPEKSPAGLRENVFGLGFFGGPATGLGLSFRHHLPSAFSYQITGGIIKANGRLRYDIGAEAQYDLARTASSRFFVAGGFGYYYAGASGTNEMEGPTRIGLGIAGEFATTAGLQTTVEVLFTYFSDGTVLPLPQLGFHYYFY
jgi:hypothetical protein